MNFESFARSLHAREGEQPAVSQTTPADCRAATPSARSVYAVEDPPRFAGLSAPVMAGRDASGKITLV
jgi:hypothetical protein